jgi:hypothetical protein
MIALSKGQAAGLAWLGLLWAMRLSGIGLIVRAAFMVYEPAGWALAGIFLTIAGAATKR